VASRVAEALGASLSTGFCVDVRPQQGLFPDRGVAGDSAETPCTKAGGFFKASWFSKYEKAVPSCFVLVWNFSSDLEELKRALSNVSLQKKKARAYSRLLLVVYHESNVPSNFEVPGKVEQAQNWVQKLANEIRIDNRHVFLLYSADLGESLLKDLAKAIAAQSETFYLEMIEKNESKSKEQQGKQFLLEEVHRAESVKRNIKFARFHELAKHLDKAMKHYELAFMSCQELGRRIEVGKVNSGKDYPILVGESSFQCRQVREVASVIHLSICALLLASDHGPLSFLRQFDRHLSSFRSLKGPEALIFQHWEWMRLQHVVFAKLLRTIASAVSLSDLSNMDRARCRRIYHLRIAVSYARKRRETSQKLGIYNDGGRDGVKVRAAIQQELDQLTVATEATVSDSEYIGGFPVVHGGPSLDANAKEKLIRGTLYLEEAKMEQSNVCLELQRKILTLMVQTAKQAKQFRRVAGIRGRIGQELVCKGKHREALVELLHASEVLYHENWYDLALPILEDIFLCANLLISSPSNEDSDASFDWDEVGNRRKVIHSILRLISLSALGNEKSQVASSVLLSLIERPVKSSEGKASLFKLGFGLDDMQSPPVSCSARFLDEEVMKTEGEFVQLELEIRVQFQIETTFGLLTVVFNDSRYEVQVKGDASIAKESGSHVENGSSTNLSFSPGECRCFVIKFRTLNLEGLESTRVHKLLRKSNLKAKLIPLRLQLKLLGNHAADAEAARLSGVSLWKEFAPEVCPLFVCKWKSPVVVEHSGQEGVIALVGELFKTQVVVRNDSEDKIEGGSIWLACDPKIPSKSAPFFFDQDDNPLLVQNQDLQPEMPYMGDFTVDIGESKMLDVFLRFQSLPFSKNTSRRQGRTCIASLVYTASSRGGIKAISSSTFYVDCSLPFETQVNLSPRNPQLPSALSTFSPCLVDIDFVCGEFQAIKICQIWVEPSAACRVEKENALDSKVNIHTTDQLIRPGERFSLPFEVICMSSGDNTSLGYVAVEWMRKESSRTTTSFVPLPKTRVEHAQLQFSVDIEDTVEKRVGMPFSMTLMVKNVTEIAQEVELKFMHSDDFFAEGLRHSTLILGPLDVSEATYTLIPIRPGNIKLPSITVEAGRLKASFTVPAPTQHKVFVAS